MISKVTESNKNLIEARIAEINLALQAAGSTTQIDSFESYFANIIEISALATNFHSAPYKFFLMPLDEPLFEIDANKRSITIPSDFNKNGVGVRGDHMAETLYFRIDRYFDHQDLYNVDEIIINWQFRPSNASRNADLPVHTSLALAPDETFDPGHIVFGWVIDKEMTPSKGSLTFSVGFLKRTGNEYEYALNTTTATVAVNDALVLEDPSVLDSLSRPTFARLSNSRYTPEGLAPLADPVFRSGDVVDGVAKGLPAVANFAINSQGVEAAELELIARGYAPDDGIVKYAWSGTEYVSGEQVSKAANTAFTLADLIPNDDIEVQEGVQYYLMVNGQPVLLSETSDPTIDDVFNAEHRQNYEVLEAASSFVINDAGQYLVSIQSIKGVTQPGATENDPAITIPVRSGNVQSQACTVPVAAVPAVELSATAAVTPETASPRFYVVEGEEDIFANYTFIEGGAPNIKAAVSINEEALDPDNGITADSSLGAIAFKLVNSAAEAPVASEFAEMSFAPYIEGQPMDVISGSGDFAEGDYCVFAVNRRNHSYSVSEMSNEIHVSQIAPVLSEINVACGEDDLIVNNAAVEGAEVILNNANPTKTIAISIGDELAEGVNLRIRVVEVLDEEHANDRNDNGFVIRAGEEDGDELAVDPDPLNDNFACLVADSGIYVVEAITEYHGTYRVTLSAPFIVSRR